jgi:hypothetical protein
MELICIQSLGVVTYFAAQENNDLDHQINDLNRFSIHYWNHRIHVRNT